MGLSTANRRPDLPMSVHFGQGMGYRRSGIESAGKPTT
jgi:hypothetical protein